MSDYDLFTGDLSTTAYAENQYWREQAMQPGGLYGGGATTSYDLANRFRESVGGGAAFGQLDVGLPPVRDLGGSGVMPGAGSAPVNPQGTSGGPRIHPGRYSVPTSQTAVPQPGGAQRRLQGQGPMRGGGYSAMGPGGAVAPGLRVPFGPVGAPQRTSLTEQVTGFDPAWGSPPAAVQRGMFAWNPSRFIYELAGSAPLSAGSREIYDHYAALASRGMYMQAYRPPGAPPGVWGYRIVHVPTPWPEHGSPYGIGNDVSPTDVAGYVDPEQGDAAFRRAQERFDESLTGRWIRGEVSDEQMFRAPLEPLHGAPQHEFRMADYAWVRQEDLPVECPYPYAYMPVPQDDYASGRWLSADYTPSIPLPPPYNTIPWRCAVLGDENEYRGKGDEGNDPIPPPPPRDKPKTGTPEDSGATPPGQSRPVTETAKDGALPGPKPVITPSGGGGLFNVGESFSGTPHPGDERGQPAAPPATEPDIKGGSLGKTSDDRIGKRRAEIRGGKAEPSGQGGGATPEVVGSGVESEESEDAPVTYDKDIEEAIEKDPDVQAAKEKLRELTNEKQRLTELAADPSLSDADSARAQAQLQELEGEIKRVRDAHEEARDRAADRHQEGVVKEANEYTKSAKDRIKELKYKKSITWNPEKRAELDRQILELERGIDAAGVASANARAALARQRFQRASGDSPSFSSSNEARLDADAAARAALQRYQENQKERDARLEKVELDLARRNLPSLKSEVKRLESRLRNTTSERSKKRTREELEVAEKALGDAQARIDLEASRKNLDALLKEGRRQQDLAEMRSARKRRVQAEIAARGSQGSLPNNGGKLSSAGTDNAGAVSGQSLGALTFTGESLMGSDEFASYLRGLDSWLGPRRPNVPKDASPDERTKAIGEIQAEIQRLRDGIESNVFGSIGAGKTHDRIQYLEGLLRHLQAPGIADTVPGYIGRGRPPEPLTDAPLEPMPSVREEDARGKIGASSARRRDCIHSGEFKLSEADLKNIGKGGGFFLKNNPDGSPGVITWKAGGSIYTLVNKEGTYGKFIERYNEAKPPHGDGKVRMVGLWMKCTRSASSLMAQASRDLAWLSDAVGASEFLDILKGASQRYTDSAVLDVVATWAAGSEPTEAMVEAAMDEALEEMALAVLTAGAGYLAGRALAVGAKIIRGAKRTQAVEAIQKSLRQIYRGKLSSREIRKRAEDVLARAEKNAIQALNGRPIQKGVDYVKLARQEKAALRAERMAAEKARKAKAQDAIASWESDASKAPKRTKTPLGSSSSRAPQPERPGSQGPGPGPNRPREPIPEEQRHPGGSRPRNRSGGEDPGKRSPPGEGGRGLIGLVKPRGTIDDTLRDVYLQIAKSPQMAKAVERYNRLARFMRQRPSASIDDIVDALGKDVTFSRIGTLRSGVFVPGRHPGSTKFWIQGNPTTAYGERVARHELVHLGAALKGQRDTFLHEVAVQAATTPEGLAISAGMVVAAGGAVYWVASE